MREIIGIMACTRLGVIGKDGSVPWNYPSEFKHFQDTTRGHIVIMGRKTFDEMSDLSLLNEHYNIVFSNKEKESDIENILFVKSIDEFKRISLPREKKIYMIGGAQIAELFLKKNMIKKFLLTKINKEYDGTVYFPLSLIKGWSSRVVVSHEDYTIYEYKNLKN